MRAFLLLAVCAGVTTVNIVLFVSSTRQLLDAMNERDRVESIARSLRILMADCARVPVSPRR